MPDVNDMELVREFARDNSEAAFTELVRRHLNLVYSVARRCTGSDGDAHDVAQAVFIILARKAAGLREKTLLTGWLYETTRFAAARLLRTNARRHAREQEAYMQSTLNEADTAAIWEKLSPHLETAMGRLNAADRALLVLRFYENKTGPEAAALLGIPENTAHKRVTRAIEKLRKVFAQRGVTLTATAIAGAVSANSVQAAPVALVKTISAIAVAKGAAATTSTLTLVKGALKIMAWAKVKTAVVIGAGFLIVAGATVATVKIIQNSTGDALWDTGIYVDNAANALSNKPPIVKIIPTKFPNLSFFGTDRDDRIYGAGISLQTIVRFAYTGWGFARTINLTALNLTALPQEKFDFIANLPSGSREALCRKIKDQFGIVASLTTIQTNVLFLRVQSTNAPGLNSNPALNNVSPPPQTDQSHQTLTFTDQSHHTFPISELATLIEFQVKIPVIDQIKLTQLTNSFNIQLHLDAVYNGDDQLEKVKQALSEVGLELVPGTAPVEFLIVEKVPK
jgi:uncharacterized protein (TIGR03435 family)